MRKNFPDRQKKRLEKVRESLIHQLKNAEKYYNMQRKKERKVSLLDYVAEKERVLATIERRLQW